MHSKPILNSLSTDTPRISRRIAIIGGGISGLSAAFYLRHRAPQHSITLFEASNRLGGVIQTLRTNDSILELGADNFATLIPHALQLSREAGFEGELLRPNTSHRLARVVCRGKVFPIPNGFSLMQPTRVSSILTTPTLSWPGKIRLLKEFFVPRRTDDSDESLESFAVRRLGKEAFERLVEPIVGGIFTAKADSLSMQAAMPQFVEMERNHGGLIRGYLAARRERTANGQLARHASGARYDQFMAPRRGMQSWIDHIAAQLPSDAIQLQSFVDHVAMTHDRQWALRVITEGKDASVDQASEALYDGLVIAIPAKPASVLLRDVSPQLESDVGAIPYADSAVVGMIIDRRELNPDLLCFGIVVPQCERRNILAISFTSEKYPERTPPDQIYVRIFLGGAVRPELFEKSDDELTEMAWKDARQLLGLQSFPRWHCVVRWPSAMPQYLVGHTKRIERIETMLKDFPSLALAGNAYRGVGIPQCVRSGKDAAQRVIDCLNIK